jgi:hypothetical protein
MYKPKPLTISLSKGRSFRPFPYILTAPIPSFPLLKGEKGDFVYPHPLPKKERAFLFRNSIILNLFLSFPLYNNEGGYGENV